MMTVAKSCFLKESLLLLYVFFLMPMSAQIIVPAIGCSQIENFDNSNPWMFGGINSSWLWDNPDKQDVTDDISIGGKSLILGGNTTTSTYNQNEDSWAESPVYDLSAVNNPYISFSFYWSNEGGTNTDELWLEYSLDNGIAWNNLFPAIGTGVCYDQNWYNYLGAWGGNNNGCSQGLGGPASWVTVRKCIGGLANEVSVKFRFRFKSDGSCENFGATIDEFKVCDATVVAQASYKCTSQNLEIQFSDESFDCPTNWFWDFGDGNTSMVANPVHSYNAAGLYTVSLTVATNISVTNGCGGPHQDTYTFDVEVMDISLNNQTNVSCAGLNDGAISLTVIGAGAGTTINWIPTPAIGQGSANISSLTAGSYDVTITSGGAGCIKTSTYIITEPASIEANYSSSDVSCANLCDGTLSANITNGVGPFNVIWSPGNLIGNVQSGVCEGDYSVSIEDANGCILSEANILAVGSPVLPEVFNLNDTVICQGEEVDIKNFELSSSVTSVNWNVIGGIDIGFGISGTGNIPDFIASSVNSVEVEVIPKLNNSCIGTRDTFTISITMLPTPDFSFVTSGNCEPVHATFTTINYNINSTYYWEIEGIENNFTGQSFAAEFLSGNYSVVLHEKTDNNCEGSVSKTDLITVLPKPYADFSFSPDYYEEEGSNISFINQSLNASSYFWSVIDTNISDTIDNPVFYLNGDSKSFYKIQLLAQNDKGCSDITERYVKLKESEIFYIPNAFTPYSGPVNNNFKPIIQSGIDIYNYKLTIFNRFGEIIFISKDPSIGWNGRLANGTKLPTGVYTYKIDYQNLYKDNPKDIIGSFLLID